MSNPMDEYLGIRKQAFGGSFGQQALMSMREGASQAVGQAAVGLTVTGLGVAAAKAYQALRKRKDFKEMLAANPDLAAHQEQDPTRFNAHYNSLRTMNPGYASDPIISGTLMRTMSMHPQTAGTVLMESMESSGRALGSSPRQFSINSKIGPNKDGMPQQETGSSYRF